MPLEPILSQSVDNETQPLLMSQATDLSDPGPQDMPSRELQQLKITKGFNTSTKQYLDRVWVMAFYKANLLFNIVRHPAFVYVVHKTACHQMPAYIPPLYKTIRTKLLIARKVDLDREVKEKMGNSIEIYGITICCDGWNNMLNQPLLNIVQCGTKGDIFLDTIDTTGNHKDHTYVATQIRPFVQMIGGHNHYKKMCCFVTSTKTWLDVVGNKCCVTVDVT